MSSSSISPELRDALALLCQTEILLVATDFDGTMAPLVARAEDARPTPESAVAFEAISGLERTRTAMISGRALASLRRVAQPQEETLLVGSHGAETWFGPDTEPLRLTDEQLKLLATTTATLQGISDRWPGTTVEIKPSGAVLHTRQADDDVALIAVAEAFAALEPLGLQLHEGKRVLEAAVLRVDKGQGLELLRRRTGATGVFFVGDDRTDEDGFRALHADDVGVKVGIGETSAAFKIGSVKDTAELFDTIFRLRSAALRSRL